MWEVIDESLECLLSVCCQSSIVRKESLSDGDVSYLGLGNESHQIEQPAIRSCVQVDSVLIYTEGMW